MIDPVQPHDFRIQDPYKSICALCLTVCRLGELQPVPTKHGFASSVQSTKLRVGTSSIYKRGDQQLRLIFRKRLSLC